MSHEVDEGNGQLAIGEDVGRHAIEDHNVGQAEE
jgi:hypothetical protein